MLDSAPIRTTGTPYSPCNTTDIHYAHQTASGHLILNSKLPLMSDFKQIYADIGSYAPLCLYLAMISELHTVNPRLTSRALSDRMGLNRRVINQHRTMLIKAGYLAVRRVGTTLHIWLGNHACSNREAYLEVSTKVKYNDVLRTMILTTPPLLL